jgi:hypothetical protein
MDKTKQEIIADLERQIVQDVCDLESSESSIGDWKVIKIYEARLQGKDDPYNADELIAQRKAARARINENQIKLAEAQKLPDDEPEPGTPVEEEDTQDYDPFDDGGMQ